MKYIAAINWGLYLFMRVAAILPLSCNRLVLPKKKEIDITIYGIPRLIASTKQAG